MSAALIDFSFPHAWQAEMLAARPLILPPRHYVYPREVEEVERGALELMVRPEGDDMQPFLATCALGFRDRAAATGIWSCPHRDAICAVAGGYAYVIHTLDPQRFEMIPYRPVLQVLAARDAGVLLFVGHRGILAWGHEGNAWESEKLSDEGVTITKIEGHRLDGMGWNMFTDKETPFSIDLQTGKVLR